MASTAQNADVKVLALGSAGINSELAQPVQNAIERLLDRSRKKVRLKVVRFLPSTKSQIPGKPSFEVLANTTVEFLAGSRLAKGRTEVIESVVTINQVDGDQELGSVVIPMLDDTPADG